MSEATDAAQLRHLASIRENNLEALAELYDGFNSAADPFSSARYAAESTFQAALDKPLRRLLQREAGCFASADVVATDKDVPTTISVENDCRLLFLVFRSGNISGEGT